MSLLSEYEPKRVFQYFEEIAKVPHGSGNSKAIADYLVDFARKFGLEYIRDEIDNVIIMKDATKGYEQAEPIILQGHTDMVCAKIPDSLHNFEKDGLKLKVDGDFLHTEGTTLGGDDGIAVAYALAILSSDDIPHPRLEVVLTSDEEIGLIGATGIDLSMLKGKKLLNIDSEEEGIILASCAGGCRSTLTLPVEYTKFIGSEIEVVLGGLNGGHSGTEIDKQRGNANELMGRLLYNLGQEVSYSIIAMEGGLADNAIPRETIARLVVNEADMKVFDELIKGFDKDVRSEYGTSDPEIFIKAEHRGVKSIDALTPISREKTVFLLRNIPNGIQRMSVDIPGLVETSLNLGILTLTSDNFVLHISVRSSIDSAKSAICDKLKYLTEFLGGDYEASGDYPGWEYRKDSPLRELLVEVYKEQYGEEPEIQAIHAGLECGILSSKIEALDCVSFGPNMYGAHTYEEKLSISSVERVWKYILAVLERSN